MRPCTSIVVCWLCASAIASAQNWPSFRGPQASGIAEKQNLPDRWDASTGENILWRTPIPGLAHSSPVVWGNQIFVTSAVSSDPKATFRPGLYGDGDTSVATSRDFLGQLLQAKSANADALAEYREALAIRRLRLGAEHPATAQTMHDMAAKLAGHGYAVLLPDVYYRHGDWEPFDMRTVFGDAEQRTRLMSMVGAPTSA